MTSFVPLRYRARALSTLGGSVPARLLHRSVPRRRPSSTDRRRRRACSGSRSSCCVAAGRRAARASRSRAKAFGAVAARAPTTGASRGAAPRPAACSRTIAAKRERAADPRGRLDRSWRPCGQSRQVDPAAVGGEHRPRRARPPSLIIGIAAAVDFALFYRGRLDHGPLRAALDRRARRCRPRRRPPGARLHPRSACERGLVRRRRAASCRWRTASEPGILMTLGADLADPPQSGSVPRRLAVHERHRRRRRPLLVAGITAARVAARSPSAVLGVLGLAGAVDAARLRAALHPAARR